jgi:hypothetical protein
MTVWYARKADVIDAASMWNDAADGSGNWLTWTGSHGADTFEANSFEVQVLAGDSFTALQLLTVSGGNFHLDVSAANVTVTADVSTTACTSTCLTIAHVGAFVLTVQGDVIGTGAANTYGIDPHLDNALTITGDVTAGSTNSSYGRHYMANSATGCTISGNVTAAASCVAINTGYAEVISIGGNLVAVAGVAAIKQNSFTYYTIELAGNLVCASDGTFPISGSPLSMARLKWTGAASGALFKYRDAALAEHNAKLPDYPAEADVKDDVQYDYAAKTGSYVGGGGYTYGDEDPDEVLTTATGAGHYVVPVQADVLCPADGGTAYGPSSATEGTLDMPSAIEIATAMWADATSPDRNFTA